MTQFLKTKVGQAILVVFSLSLLAWSSISFLDFAKERNTQKAAQAVIQANERMIERGASIESLQIFIADLERINLKNTKEGIELAFERYLDGFKEGLELAKAGKTPDSANQKIHTAQLELQRIQNQN